MKSPRLSIIIPCYNGEKYLRETLDCLPKQTIEDWECIIVNDGSTDDSLEIMNEYSQKDSRYKYINKRNEGPAVARNIGISASSGKYILPLDADDLIDPSYAEKAIAYLEDHMDTKIVYCKAEYFGAKSGPFLLPDYSYDGLLWENSIFCSCIYRKSDFEKTEGYDKNLRHVLEDWEFLISFLGKEDKVYCIPEPLFFYRQQEASRNTNSDKGRFAYQYIVKKHYDRYEPHCLDIITYRQMIQRYIKWNYEIVNSWSFQLGQFVFAPIKWVLSLLK